MWPWQLYEKKAKREHKCVTCTHVRSINDVEGQSFAY